MKVSVNAPHYSPVLVAEVGSISRDGAQLLPIAAEGLWGELQLWREARETTLKGALQSTFTQTQGHDQ